MIEPMPAKEERQRLVLPAIWAHSALFVLATAVWLWTVSTNPEWPAWNTEPQKSWKKDLGSVRLRRWGLPHVCVSVFAISGAFMSHGYQTWNCSTLDEIQREMKKRGLTHVDENVTLTLFGNNYTGENPIDYQSTPSPPPPLADASNSGRRQRSEVAYDHIPVTAQLSWICTDRSDGFTEFGTAGILQYIAFVTTPVLGVVAVVLVVHTFNFGSSSKCKIVTMAVLVVASSTVGICIVVADSKIERGHASRCSPQHPTLIELQYSRTPAAQFVLAACMFLHAAVCAFSTFAFHKIRYHEFLEESAVWQRRKGLFLAVTYGTPAMQRLGEVEDVLREVCSYI